MNMSHPETEDMLSLRFARQRGLFYCALSHGAGLRPTTFKSPKPSQLFPKSERMLELGIAIQISNFIGSNYGTAPASLLRCGGGNRQLYARRGARESHAADAK